LFNLDNTVAVADLPTMLEKYEIVLTAACRAFRQRSYWIPGSYASCAPKNRSAF